MTDKQFLELAAQKGWGYQGLTYPNPAVGAVVTKNSMIVSVEAHKKAGEPHAEVEALKSAFLLLSPDSDAKEQLSKITSSYEIHDFLRKNGKNVFDECEMFVTLEPCAHEGKTPSCAMLLSDLKPKRVVIGYPDTSEKAAGGAGILESAGIKTEILEDIGCFELLEPFLIWQKERFVFYKLAMTFGGRVSGGKISSDATFLYTHALRDKIDLLMIGGNTVRVDSPTLDSRLVNGKAPDILIYTRDNNFVRNAPLFSAAGREVFISNSLDIPENYNFVMIEGGVGMLRESLPLSTHYLFYMAPNFYGNSDLLPTDLSLKILHSRIVENNLLVWAKKV